MATEHFLTPAATEQGRVDLEGRVLCGGPKKCDGAILNVRQKCVL